MKRTLLFSGLVFLLSFTLYVFTLAPDITFEDSGELITAAAVLGNAHPPGYPLFSLISHVFTGLPIGPSTAWKVNLASAFFSSLSLALLFLVFASAMGMIMLPLLTVLLFAVTRTLWDVSTVTEVYALNLFFFALLNLLLFKALKDDTGRGRTLSAFGFIFGLAFANHQTIALIIPGVIVAFAVSGKWKQLKFKDIVLGGLFSILGVAIYLYLPIRAAAHPYMNWGNPGTFSAFLDVVLRRQYGGVGIELGTLSLILKQFLIVNPFFEFAGLRDIFDGGKALVQVPLLVLVWALAIYGFLHDKNRTFKWTALVHAFFFSLFIIMISMTPRDKEFTLKVFFLPFWAMFFYFLIQGMDKALSYLIPNEITRRAALFVVIPLVFAVNLRFCDNSKYFYSVDYADNMMMTAPAESIIITKKDNETFNLWERQSVEKKRPDLWIINYITLSEFWYVRHLERMYPGFKVDTVPGPGWTREKIRETVLQEILNKYSGSKKIICPDKEIPVGSAYKFTPYGSAYLAMPISAKAPKFEGEDQLVYRGFKKGLAFDVMTLLMMQNYSFLFGDMANIAIEAKDFPEAEKDILKSILFNQLIGFEVNNFNNYKTMGLIYLKRGDEKAALEYWDKAVACQPNAPSAKELAAELAKMRTVSKDLINAEDLYKKGDFLNALEFYKKELARQSNGKILSSIGDCYFNMNRYAEAVGWYEKAISADKTYINAYYNLGGSYLMLNKPDKAKAVWSAALAVDPGNALIQDAMKQYFKK